MAGIQEQPFHKVVLVGEEKVGKSSLLRRFAFHEFKSDYLPTIGVEFASKNLSDVKLQMWDTTGQERFRTLSASYYIGAGNVCICVDATKSDEEIRRQLAYWQEQAQQYAPNAKITLVLTKADLVEDKVLDAKQRALAAAMGIEPAAVVVCSAKTGQGLEAEGAFANKVQRDWWSIKAEEGADVWGRTVSDDAVDKMLKQLKAELDKYDKHLKTAYGRHIQQLQQPGGTNEHSLTTLFGYKQQVVTELRQHLDKANAAELRSETQFQALNAFSATLQRGANVLNTRRDPFRGHTEESLIKLAKILAACSIGIGLLAAMAVSKIATGRAYFWRTSGSDMAENMKDSLVKGHVLRPRK